MTNQFKMPFLSLKSRFDPLPVALPGAQGVAAQDMEINVRETGFNVCR